MEVRALLLLNNQLVNKLEVFGIENESLDEELLVFLLNFCQELFS